MQFRRVLPRALWGSASRLPQRRALCVRGCRVLLSAGSRSDAGGNGAGDAKSGEDLVKEQQQQQQQQGGVVWYALWRTPKGKALLTKLAVAYVAVLGLLWGVYALLPPCGGAGCSAAVGSEDAVQKLRLGGHFTLTDHTGEVFSTKEKLDGKWWLVYFGFANCPTVCPAELTKITETLHALEKEKDLPRVQPLFVTLDPDRDTPAKMADFLTPFHKSFVGLTGEMATIEEVAKKFRVYYSVVDTEDQDLKAGEKPEDYQLDHSCIIYLMNPQGVFSEFFSKETNGDVAVEKVRRHLDGTMDHIHGTKQD